MKDTIGHTPVFPIKDMNDHPGPIGLTVRDYFAAKAMTTLLQGAVLPTKELREEWFTKLASASYEAADSMLAERDK